MGGADKLAGFSNSPGWGSADCHVGYPRRPPGKIVAMIHCNAGKDRSVIAMALIMDASDFRIFALDLN